MLHAAQDIRFGLRSLLRRPGFAALGIATLALGIGANTAIFSVVNAVLLRPLPFPDSERLALVFEGIPTLGFPRVGFSPPDFAVYAAGEKSFEGLAAYEDDAMELSGRGDPERVMAARTSANLLAVLGVTPLLGRSFAADEEAPGHHVALLSYGLWQRKYAGDPSVLGQSVVLDRQVYTVVGVLPRPFQFPLRGAMLNNEPAEVLVPIAFTPAELTGYGEEYNFSIVGRLRKGASFASATAENGALAAQIKKAYPSELVKAFGNPTLLLPVLPLREEVLGNVRPLLLVLQGAVTLVLLIACVNVGLLLLSRAPQRRAEIAIRTALGAGRGRLVRQLLLETLLIAVPGGVLGVLLAAWSRGLLLAHLPPGLPIPREVATDGRVLLFTLVTTLATTLLLGLAPALQATRSDLRSPLQEGRGGATGSGYRRIQGAFVVTEFALALVLLVGAGLLLRSFAKLLATSPGFRPESVVAMSVSLPAQAYPGAAEVRGYYESALRDLAAIPGVLSVGASSDLPLEGNDTGAMQIDGRPQPVEGVSTSWVLGDTFGTLGIPILRGRGVTAEDRKESLPVVVVSESAARKFWQGGDPLGQRVKVEGGAWLTVVGIVGDVHDGPLAEAPSPHAYKAFLQESEQQMTGSTLRTLNFAVRTDRAVEPLVAAALKAVRGLDPNLPIVNPRTMRAAVDQSLSPERFNTTVVGAYAGLALLLALVGIYGVVSMMVAQQTREIGIRRALGALPRELVGLILARGARLSLAGALLGIPAALVGTRVMAHMLYGVSPQDPGTIAGATLLLAGAALVACLVPALRATRVDPVVALRDE
jgi:putative ABC transport system permease protein